MRMRRCALTLLANTERAPRTGVPLACGCGGARSLARYSSRRARGQGAGRSDTPPVSGSDRLSYLVTGAENRSLVGL